MKNNANITKSKSKVREQNKQGTEDIIHEETIGMLLNAAHGFCWDHHWIALTTKYGFGIRCLVAI